jgi:hypothetical protein
MDYLTILDTRSLLLFATPSASTTSHTSHRDSPPTTPTISLPAPKPIAIPLSNLVSPDTHLFFFLQKHILGRPEHQTTGDERVEAEVMVWRELAKAGTFIRDLGMAAGRGEIREEGLRKGARRCGLVLVRPKEQGTKHGSARASRAGCAGSESAQNEGVLA